MSYLINLNQYSLLQIITILGLTKSKMLTRNNENLWPYKRDYDIEFEIISRLPPTSEDIMIKFRSLHQHNQVETKRQSSLSSAAKQIASEAQKWWIRAGYKTRTLDDLSKEILKKDND